MRDESGQLRERAKFCPVTQKAALVLLESTNRLTPAYLRTMIEAEERLRPPEKYRQELGVLRGEFFRKFAGEALSSFPGWQTFNTEKTAEENLKVLRSRPNQIPCDALALAAMVLEKEMPWDPSVDGWRLDFLKALSISPNLAGEVRRIAAKTVSSRSRPTDEPQTVESIRLELGVTDENGVNQGAACLFLMKEIARSGPAALAAYARWSNEKWGEAFGVDRTTVSKWRRFQRARKDLAEAVADPTKSAQPKEFREEDEWSR